MQRDLIVSQSIGVQASPAQVWHVLTTPEIIREYLFGTQTITDWQVGSNIVFQGEYDGQIYRDKGVILENKPYERLSYSYWSRFSGLADKPENYSTVTYTLTPQDDTHTLFTWTQEGYATQEGYEHSTKGMNAFLEQIKAIMER